jgi:HPt (histidine-containing phosphotransfer) domain-containing protein
MSTNNLASDDRNDQMSAFLSTINSDDSAPVDMAVLASFEEVQLDDEPDIVIELIDLYLDDVPRRIEAMQTAIADSSEQSLKRAAHSLKGSSANLGVVRVAALCEELQVVNCDDGFQMSRALMARLDHEVERVRRILGVERTRRLAAQNV